MGTLTLRSVSTIRLHEQRRDRGLGERRTDRFQGLPPGHAASPGIVPIAVFDEPLAPQAFSATTRSWYVPGSVPIATLVPLFSVHRERVLDVPATSSR